MKNEEVSEGADQGIDDFVPDQPVEAFDFVIVDETANRDRVPSKSALAD